MGEVKRKYKPKIPVILLAGKAGSGKDTIAEMIRQEVETGLNNAIGDVAVLGFADILKTTCCRNHNYKNKETGRQILQTVGDEFREVQPDVFVKITSQLIKVYADLDYQVVVISDTRYQNEFDYINENVGCAVPYVIKIQREGHGGLEGEEGRHKSEEMSIQEDFTIFVPELNLQKRNVVEYSNLIREVRRVLEEIFEDFLEYR